MEYERIGKVQSGMISPSKLRRMKLIGSHHLRKKDGSSSSNNSTRTSPNSRHDYEDAEFVKNSLLASESDNFDDEVTSPSLEVLSCEPNKTLPKEKGDHVKMQHSQKAYNSTATHPARTTTDDENLGYDSSASSSSFEFHRGERPGSNPATRFLLRPIPSKWNDAEKWIMNRQNIQASYPKKNALHNSQVKNRFPLSITKVAPESGFRDHHKLPKAKVTESERVDFRQPTSHAGLSMMNEAISGIRTVAMRDMGTEMTPVASQGTSWTSTPIGSSTPLRSPTPPMPSTPTRSGPAATPLNDIEDSRFPAVNTEKLSEEELRLKTRREIQALGVQLGKMNIASWASKDENNDNRRSSLRDFNGDKHERIEFEKRAASWEEAEKSRYTARYKREDIQIQAWERQQKAKLEAEVRKIEAKVEQLRAQAHAKGLRKIAMLRQRIEEKLAAAEAERNREAARTASKAEYIRETGRVPSSNYICSCWM